MKFRTGMQSRCETCGGKIVLIKDPRVISLTAAIWIHTSTARRLFSGHPAKGPTS